MVLERILLQTIKFDLQVEHPYMFLLRYVKQLKGERCAPYRRLGVLLRQCRRLMTRLLLVEGDKNKVCKVLQMAWTFVNDR